MLGSEVATSTSPASQRACLPGNRLAVTGALGRSHKCTRPSQMQWRLFDDGRPQATPQHDQPKALPHRNRWVWLGDRWCSTQSVYCKYLHATCYAGQTKKKKRRSRDVTVAFLAFYTTLTLLTAPARVSEHQTGTSRPQKGDIAPDV